MTSAFMSDSQCSILIDRSNARTKERVYVVASNFGKWQILLKRSFFADEPKFLRPLKRFVRGDVRDQIVSPKIEYDLHRGATERCSGADLTFEAFREENRLWVTLNLADAPIAHAIPATTAKLAGNLAVRGIVASPCLRQDLSQGNGNLRF
jgi:hypothetical protein